MSSDPHSSQYRPDIDGLRAIAVVSVVLHHAFPEHIRGGFIGVDIFFVISGYLISSIILGGLKKQHFGFADFYVRRIKRIFPALFLVLATVLVMGWYQLLPVDYKQVGKHIFAGSTFISNFAFWGEAGYFDADSANKPLLHLWSLAIEEQFYIFWPLTLFALHRWRMNTLRWIFALLVVSFLINLALVRSSPTAAFYNPVSRFWELMVGAMLAAMHVHRVGWKSIFRNQVSTEEDSVTERHWRNNLWSWTGLALLVIVLLTIHPERHFPGWWALLPTLGTVLLIAAGPRAWFNRHVLASKPFVWIGLISYPLYLWHWPLLSFAHIQAGELPHWQTQMGWIALSVLLAWLTFQLVEKPIRFGRWNRKVVIGTLCAGMTAMAGSGYATYQRDGFEQRFPEIVRNMMSKGGKPAIIEGWRDGDCTLDFRLPASHYKDFCIEKKRPLVFLWGDSHAGSLYPGFKALQAGGKYNFGLGERTAAICPSVLGIEPRPLCKSLNEANIQAIRDAKPDVVLSGVNRGAHVSSQAITKELFGNANAQAFDGGVQRGGEVFGGHIERGRVAVEIRAAHGAEQKGAVFGCAGHGATLVQAGGVSDHAVTAGAAIGGLDARDAAKAGGLADRAAGVGAGRSGCQARCHSGGAATR